MNLFKRCLGLVAPGRNSGEQVHNGEVATHVPLLSFSKIAHRSTAGKLLEIVDQLRKRGGIESNYPTPRSAEGDPAVRINHPSDLSGLDVRHLFDLGRLAWAACSWSLMRERTMAGNLHRITVPLPALVMRIAPSTGTGRVITIGDCALAHHMLL